jgi:hypothetical protein
MAPSLMKNAHGYKAVQGAATVVGIPLRQVRKVIEAYAFWGQGRGQRSNMGSRENRDGSDADPDSIGRRQGVGEDGKDSARRPGRSPTWRSMIGVSPEYG